MKKTLLALFVSIALANHTYGKLYVTTDDVKVRKSKAGVHLSSLGVIKKGTIVDVSSSDGKWGVVEYQHKQGYVKIAGLREAAGAPKMALPDEAPPKEEAPDSSGLIWLAVFAGITLAGAFLVRRFKEAGKTGLARTSGSGAIIKSSHHGPSTFWYQCKHCGAMVKKTDAPSHNGCGRSSIHQWTQLAEVGLQKYSCKGCLATIQSANIPTTEGCPGGGYHSWMQR